MTAGRLARYLSTASAFQKPFRSRHMARPSLAGKRGVRPGARPRLPFERVVLAAVAGPRIEGVDDVSELFAQLGNGPQQDPLQRGDLHRVTVRRPLLHHLAVRTVVVEPLHAQVRVELRPEAGGEEAVAEEPPRGVQDEDLELGLRDGEAVRPGKLREPAD